MKEHLHDHKSKCFPMVLGDIEFMIPTPYTPHWGSHKKHSVPNMNAPYGHRSIGCSHNVPTVRESYGLEDIGQNTKCYSL